MNIKFLRGKENALPASYVEGTVYFCTDTGNLFFDTSNSRIQVSETYINNLINNVNTKIDNLTAADVGARADTWLPSLSNLGITASAAELNIMDGVTATAAEINKLDGVTATTAELNYVDGVTSNI